MNFQEKKTRFLKEKGEEKGLSNIVMIYKNVLDENHEL